MKKIQKRLGAALSVTVLSGCSQQANMSGAVTTNGSPPMSPPPPWAPLHLQDRGAGHGAEGEAYRHRLTQDMRQAVRISDDTAPFPPGGQAIAGQPGL